MRRIIGYLFAPLLALGLAGAASAEPYGTQGCSDPVVRLIDRMALQMRTLSEDIPVEVRDARGQALSAQACRLQEHISHMQREAREVSPEHMGQEAAELDREFHEFIEATESLGGEGRYLARSAERVEELDHEVMRILSGPVQPTIVQPPVSQPPVVQPVPTGYQRPYGPPYGYQTSYGRWNNPYYRR